MLDNGADVEAINAAFFDAAEDGQTDILRVLRDRGADVHKWDPEH